MTLGKPRLCAGRVALAGLLLFTTACRGLVEVRALGEVELSRPALTGAIVAADGTTLADLHAAEDRDLVPIAAVAGVLRDAVVAAEDARFYSHGGLDARAVTRALVANVHEGRVVQGGSTITQQLAKLTVTGADQTVDRKLAESSVALQLEQQFSKDEILERYLNTVYFGNGAYGVQTAARTYFDVDVGALDLPQAALLAGLIRAPATADPFRAPEAANARRATVLTRMREEGLISREAEAAAAAAPLGVVPRADPGTRAPYFVDHVLQQLQHDPTFAVLGADPVARAERVFRGGITVETTLDSAWQDAAEAAVDATVSEREDPNAALVAIDPSSGEVRALVGGRDHDDPNDPSARFNLAVDGLRQPGSAFKPLVLATALAQGYSLEDTLPAPSAISLAFPGVEEPWEVGNYDGRAFGELTVRNATRFSVNTVYAQLMAAVGPEAVIATARAAGIDRDLAPLPSLALGAQEVSVLEMASVQATLASGGIHHEPSFVRRILDADNTVLWERGTPIARRALDTDIAWQTTQALEGVVRGGTGARAFLQRPTAGKTGTTQEAADAWFTGFTPELAAAVWVGFPEGRVPLNPPRTRIPVEGGNWPAEIFARFGLRALADVPAQDFPLPDRALTRVVVDVTRDCLPNPATPPEVIAERRFSPGTEPTEMCTEPSAAAPVEVPSVVGAPLDRALRTLTAAGLRAEVVEEASPQYPPGTVTAQDPEAGRVEAPVGGYVVRLTVAASPAGNVEVPDVLGLDIDEAQQRIESAGLSPVVVQSCPDGSMTCTGATARPDQVWEQIPDAGTRIAERGAVRLQAYPRA